MLRDENSKYLPTAIQVNTTNSDPFFSQSLGFSGNFRLKIRKFQTEIILFLLLPKNERNSSAIVARVYCHRSQIQFLFLFLDTCGQTCKLDTF